MTASPDPDESPDVLAPAELACLERTRSAVLNVLVADGLSILASALVLRNFGPVSIGIEPERMHKGLFGSLFVVFAVGVMILRTLGSRDRLAEPGARASRFFRAHLIAAAVGWLAMPLGLIFGLTVEPSLRGVAPFWLAAMILGKLAYPRAIELGDFDEPLPTGPESTA